MRRNCKMSSWFFFFFFRLFLSSLSFFAVELPRLTNQRMETKKPCPIILIIFFLYKITYCSVGSLCWFLFCYLWLNWRVLVCLFFFLSDCRLEKAAIWRLCVSTVFWTFYGPSNWLWDESTGGLVSERRLWFGWLILFFRRKVWKRMSWWLIFFFVFFFIIVYIVCIPEAITYSAVFKLMTHIYTLF